MPIKKVLILGALNSPLRPFLRKNSWEVEQTEDPISKEIIMNHRPDWVVSYGYRHILSKSVLELMPKKILNLHIGFLPWNRGVDPNLWSFIDDTPKGVTIHYIDAGIDTGNIIAQRQVFIADDQETFASFHRMLHQEIIKLFMETWDSIVAGTAPAIKQASRGTFHCRKDKEIWADCLPNGWDTSIRHFKALLAIKRGMMTGTMEKDL